MPIACWFMDGTPERMKPPGAGLSFPKLKVPSLLKLIRRCKTGSQDWGSPGWQSDMGHGCASQWGQHKPARAPTTVPRSITEQLAH